MLGQAEDLLQKISLVDPTRRMLISKKEAEKKEEKDILEEGIDGGDNKGKKSGNDDYDDGGRWPLAYSQCY